MAMQSRGLIGKPGHEASPRVIGGVAFVQVGELWIWIDGADLEATVFKSRAVIDGVTPGEVREHAETVAETLVDTGLKRVVGGVTLGRLRSERPENTSIVDRVIWIIQMLEEEIRSRRGITGRVGKTLLLP